MVAVVRWGGVVGYQTGADARWRPGVGPDRWGRAHEGTRGGARWGLCVGLDRSGARLDVGGSARQGAGRPDQDSR